MYAIDTNVLVRIIIQDDEVQMKKAVKYVEECGDVFISLIVLCEFSWVVTSVYEFDKHNLLDVIENILRTEQFSVQEPDSVREALNEYKKSNADFSDCLIGAIAKNHRCANVATFDKRAAKSTFFELIV